MKAESDEWQVECGGKKVKLRAPTTWVSYRVARRDIMPEAMKKLDVAPGVQINLTAPNGSVYFTNRPAPPAPVPTKKAKAKAKG